MKAAASRPSGSAAACRAGLFGVDVTDLIEAGASPAAILERRILEIERRVAELQRLAQPQQQSEEQSLMEQPRRPQPSTSSVEAKLLKVREFLLSEYSSAEAEANGYPVDRECRPAWDALHDALTAVHAAALSSPERELMREALEGARMAISLFVRSSYAVASEINERGYNWSESYLDEARKEGLAQLAKIDTALAPPTAQSGDRT